MRSGSMHGEARRRVFSKGNGGLGGEAKHGLVMDAMDSIRGKNMRGKERGGSHGYGYGAQTDYGTCFFKKHTESKL